MDHVWKLHMHTDAHTSHIESFVLIHISQFHFTCMRAFLFNALDIIIPSLNAILKSFILTFKY